MVDVKEMLNKLLMVARDDRASIPYSHEEGFVPKLIFIGPNDEVSVSPALWSNEADKYALMERAAEGARRTFAQAIVLVSDTRWIESDVFCEHFKINPTTDDGHFDLTKYQEQYLAILRQHGGKMKNLPRQLWREAISVAMKGPRCGTHCVMAPYIQGPGDKVQYIPKPSKLGEDDANKYEMRLIPEWWV